MGSRGRMPPPPHLRHPLPGPGIPHPDAFTPGMRPPPGAFPPFDMPPHPEILEQKVSSQHMEMQKLLTEDQRLAGTQGTLRQELAAAQHELQILHAQIGAVKSERDHQVRGLVDKIARMEADLQAADSIKSELEKVRADAQSLVVARQELVSKVQRLTQDLQRAHGDAQIIPALVSELEGLRREYQHCRATYDYEKKLYNDHLESLQVMEKNYVNMAREVEKLQSELKNMAPADKLTAGAYGSTGYENEVSLQYPAGQKVSEDGYGVPQGHGALPGSGTAFASVGGIPAQAGSQSGPAPPRAGYDAPPPWGPGCDAQNGPYYDPQRGYGYGAPGGGAGYQQQRGYDLRGHAYEAQWGVAGYEARRGPGYDMSKGAAGYDASKAAGNAPQGPVAPSNNAALGSTVPPNRAGAGAGAGPTAARGGNPVHRQV